MAQCNRQDFPLRCELHNAITRVLVEKTTLHYEACSKLAGEKASEIVNEVRLMNLPDNPDVKTVFPAY